MVYMRFTPGESVEVSDYRDLRAAWKGWMVLGESRPPVDGFIVSKPLTASQSRRLPKALRPLVSCPNDSVAWLERLYSLLDPR